MTFGAPDPYGPPQPGGPGPGGPPPEPSWQPPEAGWQPPSGPPPEPSWQPPGNQLPRAPLTDRTGPGTRGPNNNSWATLALIAAVISFSVPAIVLGYLALRRSQQLGGVGRRRSIAAMAIGGLWLIASLIAFAMGGGHMPTNLPFLPGGGFGGSAAHPSVTAGQCIDFVQPETDGGATFEVVTCTGPHDAEVFGVANVRDANGNHTWRFPGAQVVTEQADNFCPTAFSDYVGSSPETSELQVAMIVPGEETWSGQRSIICYATPSAGGQLPAGTIRNSGR